MKNNHRRNFPLQRERVSAGRVRVGFTLAEVLITLGIIGIVAAMTMPTLIEKHQKKVTATRLKEAYSILSQALLMAQKDYDEPKFWLSGKGQPTSNRQEATTEWVEKYVVPYIKTQKVHGWKSLSDVGFKTAYVALNGKPIPSGTNYSRLTDKGYMIELPNQQMLIFVYDSYYTEGTSGAAQLTNMDCHVDINGKQKPNMWGRDMFLFEFSTSNGKLLPYGNGSSREDLIQNSCTKSTEWGNVKCTSVIMKDGWEIKDDYPW